MKTYRVAPDRGAILTVRARGITHAAQQAAAHRHPDTPVCVVLARGGHLSARHSTYDIVNYAAPALLGRISLSLCAPDGRRLKTDTCGVTRSAATLRTGERPASPADSTWYWRTPTDVKARTWGVAARVILSDTEGATLMDGAKAVRDAATNGRLACLPLTKEETP